MPLADDSGHRAPALGPRRPQDPERMALFAGCVHLAVRARNGAESSSSPTSESGERMSTPVTTLAPIDAYRLLARDYDRSPSPMLGLEQRTMAPLFPRLCGARVVDAAAGTG